MERAVIDIGSNSIRLLLEGSLVKYINSTQLAEGLTLDNTLQPIPMERTRAAINEYYTLAKAKGADEIYVFATEAVRSANNGKDFVKMLKDDGIDVDVLSPKKEALAGYLGAGFTQGKTMVIDIGGASTEIIIGQEDKIIYSRSLPIGIVRLRDQYHNNLKELRDYISKAILDYGKFSSIYNVVAIGGSASTMASILLQGYDREKVHHYYLTRQDIDKVLDILMTKDRKDILGLPKMRASVMLGGVVLLQCLLEHIDIDGVIVSEEDVMEGYLKILEH